MPEWETPGIERGIVTSRCLSCSPGSTTKLVTWMHVLSFSLASIDEEWFPENRLELSRFSNNWVCLPWLLGG